MKKHLKYLSYVIRHKWFVFLACCSRGIIWQGIVHDWSKFLPSEWMAYVEFFNGDPLFHDTAKVNDAFDVAWLKHQHRSPHHWQHWVLRNDDGTTVCIEMPRRYVLEMLCDWEGAGRAIMGRSASTPAWYAKNREQILLHSNTRTIVDRALNYHKIKFSV